MESVVHRVYRREWVIVYTSDARGSEGRSEASEWASKKYGGRLLEGEVRVVPASEKDPDSWQYLVEVRIPTLRGEFKTEALALDHAYHNDNLVGAEVVARFSDEDRRLREYGVRKIPDTVSGIFKGFGA